MSINLYQREIYANQLQHGERRNHKYLYKEGNRYIYPEDLKKDAQNAGRVVKNKATELYNDRHIYADAAKNMASDYSNAIKDKWNNGGKETAKKIGKAMLPIGVRKSIEAVGEGGKVASSKVPNYKDERDKAEKKRLEERRKINQQQDNAHRGYVEDQKKFGDEPTSTEELERQKAKTHARKRLKDDAYNRFRKDPAIDNDPEVRAARKKWLGKEENDWDGKNTVTAKSAAGRSINAHKMYDSVSRTPHEGSKRRAKVEKFIEGERSGNARNEYLAARQRAAEKDYLTQTRKARETKARTEDTVERMRKKKKRSSR